MTRCRFRLLKLSAISSRPRPSIHSSHQITTNYYNSIDSMTTLLTIPDVKALHVASPGVAPLPLSSGDLTLVVIPANPPTHPSETITLSVGSSSFPLLPNSPLQRVKAKEEHASYLFSPVSADGGAGVGQVLLQMKGR
jgi:hypothetical protein